MKPIYAAMICALAMVASRPAQARGDDLDELLSSPVAASTNEAPSTFDPASSDTIAHPAEHFGISESDSASYADQSRWHPAIGLSPTPTKTKSSDASAHKTSPSGDLNLVPEPSAVVLAGLALVYFLVFGRRRVFS